MFLGLLHVTKFFKGEKFKMKIEKISIEKIKPYENNAKLHPPEQIEQIKKSIIEFGNNDPIVIDENNVIIEGHGRYFALKELGFKEAEVIKLSHLNKEQKKAYSLVHNKLTMNTGFDLNILSEELDTILDFDMSEYDFFDLEPMEISRDFDKEKDVKINTQVYLKYKNKMIPVSDEEEKILDEAISKYSEEKGVLYGFVSEAVNYG